MLFDTVISSTYFKWKFSDDPPLNTSMDFDIFLVRFCLLYDTEILTEIFFIKILGIYFSIYKSYMFSKIIKVDLIIPLIFTPFYIISKDVIFGKTI